MEKGTYPNPAVVTASKSMVCLVAHGGARNWDTTHGSKTVKQGGESVKMCKLYDGIVCTDHVDTFKERAAPTFGNKVFATPHHLYYTPAGEEIFRNAGSKNPQELAKDFADALAKVPGTRVSKEDYDGARVQVANGVALVKKDEIKKAIEAFTKLTKHANELLRPMGQRELDALEANGNARYDAAIQALNTSEENGKKELKKIAEEYAPLPCSKKAQEMLKLMAEKGR